MINWKSSVFAARDKKVPPPGDHWWPADLLSRIRRPWNMQSFRKLRESIDDSRMRVLVIGFSDAKGGAAIASSRLMQKLESRGGTATLQVVGRQTGDASWTVSLDRAHRFIVWRQLRKALAARNIAAATPYGWMPFEYAYIQRVLDIWQPHVIHLHNLHGGWGTIPLRAMEMLSARAPIVWTLHDMWAATGHCAYSLGCDRWLAGCGECPDLSLYPAMWRDRTRGVVVERRRIYEKARPVLVTPSRWLRDLVRNAYATQGLETHVIPNGVDLTVFNPAGREATRERLGIADDRPVLMFAAETLDGDRRKGGPQLRAAIEQVQEKRDGRPLDIILMGGSGENLLHGIAGLVIHDAGFVSEPAEAAGLYAAADLFICPSLQDNLPNTLIEAAACGTAAAVFDAGGSAETVDPGITGIVVPAGDATALANAIAAIADDSRLLTAMGNAARKRTESLYSDEIMAERYAELYKERMINFESNTK